MVFTFGPSRDAVHLFILLMASVFKQTGQRQPLPSSSGRIGGKALHQHWLEQ
ncbi:hypothetical protein [Echinicola salinicaeni]|uniref:hypothetical protein n=1 Tax=Echinicola salinicaeni TaxID=2762757 RepID=UPI001E50D397|nr:hypothetical protein [Echinicola salinicaeni]